MKYAEKLKSKIYDFQAKNISEFGPALSRVEIEIKKTDLLDWLYHQDFKCKVYWRSKNCELEIAGVGCAIKLNAAKDTEFFAGIKRNLNENIKCFGGFSFSRNKSDDNEWKKFGAGLFFVPRFEIIRIKSNYRLACNFSIKEKPEVLNHSHHKLNFNYTQDGNEFPHILNKVNYPEYNIWADHIQKAYDLIKNQRIEKIVLSRKTKLTLSDKIDPFILLSRLKSNSINATLFGFQIDNGLGFIGASPEILFRIRSNQIYSEAIAGTRPRGKHATEDLQLEKQLFESKKDKYEHEIVVKQIEQVLEPFCESLNTEKTSILKLKRVQHLFTPINGYLTNGFNESEIINELHPTPAVGGFPSKKAIREINNIEKFNRGWYASPVGWISKSESEFAVAIRSGLVNENKITLFSGAGIVEGSQAKSEWLEMENKIDNFLKILT